MIRYGCFHPILPLGNIFSSLPRSTSLICHIRFGNKTHNESKFLSYNPLVVNHLAPTPRAIGDTTLRMKRYFHNFLLPHVGGGFRGFPIGSA